MSVSLNTAAAVDSAECLHSSTVAFSRLLLNLAFSSAYLLLVLKRYRLEVTIELFTHNFIKLPQNNLSGLVITNGE